MDSHFPYIALTDERWFRRLLSRSDFGRLDEANFWQPSGTRPPAFTSRFELVTDNNRHVVRSGTVRDQTTRITRDAPSRARPRAS